MDKENEIIRLKNCLKAADDVVSYIVYEYLPRLCMFGSAPTDRLAKLVSICMAQRRCDKENRK
jgi:hypothetical protein